jgi:aquaporin Z
MEAGELGVYIFFACVFATLLRHPASAVRQVIVDDVFRRMLLGLAMGATLIAIVSSPWGKQSGAHFYGSGPHGICRRVLQYCARSREQDRHP